MASKSRKKALKNASPEELEQEIERRSKEEWGFSLDELLELRDKAGKMMDKMEAGSFENERRAFQDLAVSADRLFEMIRAARGER